MSFFQGQYLIWKLSNHSQINNDGDAILPSFYKLFFPRPSFSLNEPKATRWQEKMGEDWGESGLKRLWYKSSGLPLPAFFYPLLSLFSGLVFFARPDQLSLKHTLLNAFFKALKLGGNIKPVYTKGYDHCIHYILASFLQINAKYNKWVNLQFRLVNRVGRDSDTLLCVTLTLYFDLQDHNESKGRVKRATKTYNLFCNIPLKRFK